ncbi:MAG TPA: hypothetical protein VGK02_12125 [Candidatus Aquicultor sp.]|jgi:hypothetical protein
MEEQAFALMLRQVLTEYDFDAIEITENRAHVALKREVFTDTSNDNLAEYDFSNPVLVEVLQFLKTYLPAL